MNQSDVYQHANFCYYMQEVFFKYLTITDHQSSIIECDRRLNLLNHKLITSACLFFDLHFLFITTNNFKYEGLLIFLLIKQPHRPRNDGGNAGGGGRHKKRVRQPHNTRERQRQLAVGHGEYIMPTQGVQYRTPHNIPDESLLGMVMTDPRPPRPNSIELRRSYPPDEQHLYSPPTTDHYR